MTEASFSHLKESIKPFSAKNVFCFSFEFYGHIILFLESAAIDNEIQYAYESYSETGLSSSPTVQVTRVLDPDPILIPRKKKPDPTFLLLLFTM